MVTWSSRCCGPDRMVGLDLADQAGDGGITKASSDGECTGKSPVDRGKRGLKRSQLTDGYGIPVVTVPAGVNIRDHTLLPETLDEFAESTEHLDHAPQHPALSLDAGYDHQLVHTGLTEREITPRTTKRGTKTPIQTDGRWAAERTNSWMNNFGKLRRNTERRRLCTEFYLALATAGITVRSLIRRAWSTHRWDTRPTSPRIRQPQLTSYPRTLPWASAPAARIRSTAASRAAISS